MSKVLKKSVAELRVVSGEQFVRLFGLKGRNEFLLEVLDRKVQKQEGQGKRKGIEAVCRGVLSHVKSLVNIYQKEQEQITEDESIVLRYKKNGIIRKLEELYSLQGAKEIVSYARKLVDNKKGAILDKSMKMLIYKEYITYSKNDISSFKFPHGQILDHYAAVTQWWKALEFSENGFVTIQVFTEFLKAHKIASTP